MTNEWRVHLGPRPRRVSLQQLIQLIKASEVLPDTMVDRSGMPPIKAGRVPALRAAFPAVVPLRRNPVDYRRSDKLLRVTTMLLVAYAALSLANVPLQYLMHDAAVHGRNAGMTTIALTSLVVGVSTWVAGLTSFVPQLMLIYRCCHNARALGGRLSRPPWATLVTFFVPVVGLIMPLMGLLEVWRLAQARGEARSAVTLYLWWTMMIASTATGVAGTMVAFVMFADSVPELFWLRLIMLSGILCAASAMFFILFFRALCVRQERQYLGT